MGGNTAIAALVAYVFVLQFSEKGDCGLPAKRQFVVGDGDWINNYDGGLAFNCPGINEAISGIYSVHSNWHEDRKFRIECSSLPTPTSNLTAYAQPLDSGYVNEFDINLFFECPSDDNDVDSVMTGMHSYHLNYYEDRRWSFTCTTVPGFCLGACYWTHYNTLESPHNVPTIVDYFFAGAKSYHYSTQEDRQWSYKRCRLRPC